MSAMDRIKEKVWFKTNNEFTKYLDTKEIYPHLRSHLLITTPQSESLLNQYIGSDLKINNVMEWMPGKGGSWFADFVDILKKTKDGTGHFMIIKALKANFYTAGEEQNEISQEAVEAEIIAIFGPEDALSHDGPLRGDQQQQQFVPPQQPPPPLLQQPPPPQRQPPPSRPDPMNSEPFVNDRDMTEDKLDEEYDIKTETIQAFPLVETKEDLSNKVPELETYTHLIEVVNDIEFKTAICEMDGNIYQYTVRDYLTESETTYFFGKWKNVPVVVLQTGKRFGSQFQYGSWFETKKALYYMPQLKHVFGVGVCGAAVDLVGSERIVKPRVPLGHVVVSSHINGYDHQKKMPKHDENRSLLCDSTQNSFYQFLDRAINKRKWEKGLHFGWVLSGSWLVADIEAQKSILNLFRNDEIAFEMEGVGIAAACQYGTSNRRVETSLVVKGVSDYANRDKSDAWQPAAARNATRYLSDMINRKVMPNEP